MQNIREVLKDKHSFDNKGRIIGTNFILKVQEDTDNIIYNFELENGNYIISISKEDSDNMEILQEYKMSAVEHVKISSIAWDMHQDII